jgi:TRAP-type mannitol/chloroaromatic compound transport system substrate-binding protein
VERRRFIVKAGGTLAAAAAAVVVDAPNVIAQPKVQWRMSTAWTKALRIIAEALRRESLESTKIHTQVSFERTRRIAELFALPGV